MTDEPTAEEMARTLRSEARKVKRYLRVHEKGFRIRTLAGFDVKEEAQVRALARHARAESHYGR